MVIPKINSAHGSDTRNILNRAIDLINAQGKSIQDLVAEGQLTPSQYAQLISIVNGNVKKGGITTEDIDKNNFKVDSTMITDSLRQMIAGIAEINAVPANNSIGTEKLINESVTKAKRTLGGEVASVLSGTAPINIDTINKEVLISESSYVVNSKNRRSILTNIIVPFNVGTSATIAFDTVNETFRSLHTQNVHLLNENEVIIMNIIFTTPSQNEVKSVSSNSEYTINGNVNLPDNSITTRKVAKGSITPEETSFVENINLINKNNLFRGYTTDNTTGELTPLNNFSTTDFIRVGGDSDISFRNVEKVTYYDENKNYITNRGLVRTPQHITTSSDQIFIRCVIVNDFIDEAMLYTGHDIKEYEPFSVKVLGVDISKIGTGGEADDTNIETVNAYPIRLQKDEIYTAELREDVSVGSAGNVHRLNSLDIHALYDDLLNANTDYVSKELLGTEPSGKDIYAYHFNEDFSENTPSDPLKKPKILLVSGTHGHEALAVWLNYLLAKELCDNWKSSDALDNLRNNVHIIIIPVQNPFGFDNISDHHGFVEGIRTNSNGVDIARNFPSQWNQGVVGSVTYGGTEPFSEIESQIVDNLIKREIENLVYVCDLHNFATKNNVIWNASATDFHVNLAEHLISNMFSKWRKETDFLNDLGNEKVGVANHGSPGGSLSKHAVVEYGIFGDTFEVSELFPYGESDVRNLPNAVKFGEEAYVNWLSLVVKNQLNMQ